MYKENYILCYNHSKEDYYIIKESVYRISTDDLEYIKHSDSYEYLEAERENLEKYF